MNGMAQMMESQIGRLEAVAELIGQWAKEAEAQFNKDVDLPTWMPGFRSLGGAGAILDDIAEELDALMMLCNKSG